MPAPTKPYHGLFSEALNDQPLVTNVSPQTGVFQASLPMAKIEIGLQNPVTFSLNLLIGMNASMKIALALPGILESGYTPPQVQMECASFNIPFFSYMDEDNPKWYTASGAAESLATNLNGTWNMTVSLVYHKTKDIKISSLTTDSEWKGLKVEYKDGTVEVYKHFYQKTTVTLLYSLLDRRISPAGHVLSFTYDKFKRIIKIEDLNNTSNYIGIDYADAQGLGNGLKYTVTQSTYGQTFESIIWLKQYTGSRIFDDTYYLVKTASLPSEPYATYDFEFDSPGWNPDGGLGVLGPDNREFVLKSVKTPYGLVQRATYATLDYGYIQSQLKTVPVIKDLYVVDVATGDDTRWWEQYTISYQFKTADNTNNYTGYTPNTTVTPGRDECIYKSGDYEYTTTEVHGMADAGMGDHTGAYDRKIIRTYNRFHLLVKERTLYRDAGSLSEEVRTYTYPVVPGDITRQPANFQFWETCTTGYVMDGDTAVDPATVKRQTQRFDEYGNLLTATAESGISQIYEYYDVAGETGLCPPALNGIKQHVKSIETVPLRPAHLPEPAPPEPASSFPVNKKQVFTYVRQEGVVYPGVISPYMVLLRDTQVRTAEGMLTLSTSTYSGDKEPRILLGVPKTIETTSPAQGEDATKVVKNWTEFSWSVIDEGKTVKKNTTTCVTVGGVRQTDIKVGSTESRLADGLVVKETSASGVDTTYEYNESAQLIKKTSFANKTEYREVEEFSFSFACLSEAVIWPDYKIFGLKNLVTYKKVRADGEKDTSISFRYYLGADFQVCAVSQGPFTESDAPADIDPNAPDHRIVTRSTYRPNGLLESETLNDSWEPPPPQKSTEYIRSTTKTNELSNVNSTVSPEGVSSIETINLQKNLSYSGVSGASVCYLQELNNFGSVNVLRLAPFGSNHTDPAPFGYQLQVNTYDGFGRLASAVQPEIGGISYVYDEFDRVREESEMDGSLSLIQKTAYTYSTHIPSMALPVTLKCIVDTGKSVLMDAKREYDAFSRLVSQTMPNVYPATVLTEKYEYTDLNFPYQPTKLSKDIGFVTYSYDDCTGMLLKKSLNNGSGSGQPPALDVEFTYDKKTKLLQGSSVGLPGSMDKQSRYFFTYDRLDRLSTMTVSFEGDDSDYVTHYRYMLLSDTPVNWGIYELGSTSSSPLCECGYEYDRIGRVKAMQYRTDDRGNTLATVNATVTYVDNTQGFASGNIESVVLSSPDFSPGFKGLTVTFRYDERGQELQRTYSFRAPDDGVSNADFQFLVGNILDNEQRITRKEIHQGTKREGGEWGIESFSKKYSYWDAGDERGLSVSESIKHDTGTTPGTTTRVSYTSTGCAKLKTVATSIDNVETGKVQYIYVADRVNMITPVTGTGITATYEYDGNGNVNKDAKFNFLRYDVENALATYGDTSAGPMRETRYYYSPSGELNRMKGPDGESVYYFYNAGELAVEVSPGLRTFYLRVGNILLGRVLVYPAPSGAAGTSCVLEIFGTDSAGSVRAEYRFTAGESVPGVSYYDYSDYGERTPG
ncbi:hypothetical protein C4K04_4707 [Pseudomonas chlororaphis]|uniref:YD repeat-containing protein n=1 Tax=Pseudomonas chlororaphis TaxID=587753 RepID=A0A3G7TVD1_9PSED|nr:hypothetical protein [Pseudomonas chlororaphis]AZE50362.1 hypothetical protein C4K04_4707 [Pseudomonas chlororaphis]